MQQYPLTLDKFIDHAAKWHGASTVVTASRGTVQRRVGYAELRARSNRLSGALTALGLGLGDRVGTLAWNTQHHLELYYATMSAGLVCHTLNPRLTPAHLSAMINEAADRVLAIAANLVSMLPELLPLCPTIERVLVLDEAVDPSIACICGVPIEGLEALIEARGKTVQWGQFDETSAAGLCFTSGTTGKPKGVVFSHRSNYLHTLMSIQPDAYCLSAKDTILVAIPMFHANAWGLPFSAPAVGASLVLPGRDLDGASLASLIRSENVTIAGGVQTVWIGLLDHLDATGEDVPSLERVIIGGSKCPDALMRRMEDRLGARVQTTWGMTEMSPLGTVDSIQFPPASERSSGRPPIGVDLKLTDADGATLARQRGVIGHLKVKGPSIIDRYFNAAESALDAEGYFDTGDLATIDEGGALTICGRSKDLIKSGGEWINPAEMEAIIGRDPRVGQVAVIGKPHPKWGERPVLVVELRQGETGDARAFFDALRGKVADWWLPDEIVQLPAMPLAATGKIDKVRLRADYETGELDRYVATRP
ncbi:AMP-dependent synthetase [Caulobacter sp. Root1455]|uniref:AMP-binding protein n=1 Tax=unclassified Caulobacter TaxID=2648921 RepID=UPI0006F225A9|nr:MULTISPECIES: AMP-binding protein [unclassified Caulobacter]KQY28070.1 AMP-dependent synthetase [Caulobacter sp. Root487D2Y]KQZ04767.1 AMP-dependent synthetase [Caulobacter sp. Root1455]